MTCAVPPPSTAETHVVVVSYNGLGCIDDCLRSLASEPRLHVHVLDNGSVDGTAAHVAARFPWVRVTQLSGNLGFGRGNNIGIAQALQHGARFILLLNQDTVVPPGSIAALCQFLAEHPKYAACSPLQCTPDLLRPDPKTLAHYLAPHAQAYLADLVTGRPQDHYRIHGVNAAVWLVRADAFRSAGGFDPLFFMYGEDDDLLSRWRHHGMSFALVPGVRVAHSRYRSPPIPGARVSNGLARAAGWAHSRLLLQALGPAHGAGFIAKTLIVRGLVNPLLDVLIDHDWTRLCGWWWATFQLLCRLPTLARHAALTARPGAHFLGKGHAEQDDTVSSSPISPSSYPC